MKAAAYFLLCGALLGAACSRDQTGTVDQAIADLGSRDLVRSPDGDASAMVDGSSMVDASSMLDAGDLFAASADLVALSPDLTVSSGSLTVTVVISNGAASGLFATTGPTAFAPSAVALGTACVPAEIGRTCTLHFDGLAPGEYTTALDVFAGADGTGARLATAPPVAFSIAAASDTPITIVLRGVPVTLGVEATSVATLPDGEGGFRLVGMRTRTLRLIAKDAAGATIPSESAPAFSASVTGDYDVAVDAPTATYPSLVTLTPPATWDRGADATLAITASFSTLPDPCSLTAEAMCNTTVRLRARELLGVTTVDGTAELFDIAEDPPLPIATLSLDEAVAPTITFDDDGNAVLVGFSPSKVIRFAAPDYTSAVTISGFERPVDGAMNAAGDTLYTIDDSAIEGHTGFRITSLAPPWTAGAIISAGNQPASMLLSPDENIVYSFDLTNALVVRLDTATGTVLSPFPITVSQNYPVSVATTTTGDRLFVTNLLNVKVLTASDGTITDTVAMDGAYGVAYERKNHHVCVAAYNQTAVILADEGDGSLTPRTGDPFAYRRQWAAADANGACYFSFALPLNDNVVVVDAATGTVLPSISVPRNYRVTILP